MHTRANEIVAAGTRYVGVPYREQGRNMFGLDCAGVVVCAGVEGGALGPDAAERIAKDYSRRPNVEEFTRSMLDAGCTRLQFGQQEHGDILRIAYLNWPVHIGLYEVDGMGRRWLIHAYLPLKKVVREQISPAIEGRINTVWRYPE